jgi:hypothetical protein
MSAYGFHNFKLSFCEGNPNKNFPLDSMQKLANFEILSSKAVTLNKELVLSF